MSSQYNFGRQYDKRHAVTIVATAALAENRFVAYSGGYPTTAGGANNVQGVTEFAVEPGEAVCAITSYSALVEAAEPIPFGTLVKSDAAGKAVVGSAADHCAIALGAATMAGKLLECQLLPQASA